MVRHQCFLPKGYPCRGRDKAATSRERLNRLALRHVSTFRHLAKRLRETLAAHTDVKPPRFEKPSNATAAMRMRPVATGCQKGETPNRLRPFATTPSRKTPTIVPAMRPRPPPSGAPPTMTAAIAVSS